MFTQVEATFPFAADMTTFCSAGNNVFILAALLTGLAVGAVIGRRWPA